MNLRRRCVRAAPASARGVIGEVGRRVRHLAQEDLADLGAVAVDRRHQDVAGQVVVELHDQLGEGLVHAHLLGGHGLDLDHRRRRPRTGGAPAAFTKTSRLLADLAGGHADHTWATRLRRWARPALLICDDFAMRELSMAHADDLYELITERAGRPMILTSNRTPADWYPLFPNPVVAESILDRIINTAHHVGMPGRSYRPRRRPTPAHNGATDTSIDSSADTGRTTP